MALLKIRTISELSAGSPQQPDGNTMKLLAGKRLLLPQPKLVNFTIIFIKAILGKVYTRVTVGSPAAGSAPGTHCLTCLMLIFLLL